MGATVQIQGLEKILDLLGQLPKRAQRAILAELKVTADEIANNAKRDAPADQGRTRGSISVAAIPGGYQDVVQNDYAAYMEFGTKGSVQIPAGLQSFAATFRGKGTPTGDPLKALEAWVKRKGIAGRYSTKTKRRLGNSASKAAEDKRVAYLIWRKIKKYGVKPHPFFFKQIPPAEARLKNKLAQVIQQLIQ